MTPDCAVATPSPTSARLRAPVQTRPNWVSPPAASIVIATRNRRDLLCESIEAALAQSVPVEVIVLDDGSSDGTEDAVRRRFPEVVYERHPGGCGPCLLRNRGTKLARARFVFPIDDDAVMVSPRCVEQTLADFDDPRIGAVAIPFIDVRRGPEVKQRSPDDDRWIAHAYVGAAHALRRDVFLALGGYREHFFYMGEEGDLCLRMLEAGMVVRLGRADPMHHHESLSRDTRRADILGRQNDVLFAWHNVPARALPLHMAATTAGGVVFGVRSGHPRRAVVGLARGYSQLIRRIGERNPVSVRTYRLGRRLKLGGPVRLHEIENDLRSTSPAVAESIRQPALA